MNPSVIVGIISYNRASVLPKAIDSALRQQDVNLSVVVLDNKSTDNTRSLASSYPGVQWIFSEENKGVSRGRNELLRLSGFDYFVSLDDDSWFLDQHSLAKAIQLLEHDKHIAAIAFDILTSDKPSGDQRSGSYEVSDFIGCGHVLRIDHVREAGYYNFMPGYYGGEEKDLCLKLIDLGYRIVKMPDIKIWHDKSSLQRDLFKQNRSGVCNDLVSFFRRAPLFLLVPGLALKIINHIRFAHSYKPENVTRSAYQGVGDFLTLLFKFKLRRSPVKFSTIKTVRRLPTA